MIEKSESFLILTCFIQLLYSVCKKTLHFESLIKIVKRKALFMLILFFGASDLFNQVDLKFLKQGIYLL